MNILIVDDHPIVRAGLRRLLGMLPDAECREAGTGREALARVREHRPDVVMLDLNLPGLGGLELVERLTGDAAGAPRIIVFSMHSEAIYARRALAAGAAGYLSKDAQPDEILEAVRRVAAGGRYVEAEIAQDLAVLAAEAAPGGGPRNPVWNLSPRDMEIVRQLAAGAGVAEIADALGLSYKTVANICTHIKATLGVGRTSDLVRLAIENGIA